MLGSGAVRAMSRRLRTRAWRLYHGCITRVHVPSIVVLLLALPSAAYSAGATYVYDRAGRLIHVIAPNGSSAIYSYDGAGNILSIQRILGATLAVTGFSRWVAPPGTTIIIYGSGFSAVPAQNQVSFGGVAATVTAATENTLTVVVPSGAIAGNVSVTTSSGTASSSAPFATGTSHAAPTLLSIEPFVGNPGDAVVLSGSGFPWGIENNSASFNGAAAQISTVTSSAIRVTAPNAARSGRVHLTGSYGNAVGAIDFLTPLETINIFPEDIELAAGGTGRLYVDDGPVTSTITTAGKVGMFLVDATVGEELSLQPSNSTIPPINGSYPCLGILSFHRPGAALPAVSHYSCSEALYYKVTHAGAHAFSIIPSSTGSGSITLNVQSAPTVTTAVALGDPATTLTTTVPAQRSALTFSTNSSPHNISLQVTNAQFPTSCSSSHSLKLLGPAPATTVVASRNFCTSATAYNLSTAGTYTVLVDPYQNATGSIVVKVDDATTVTGALTLGGSAVTVSTSVPAQLAKLTFTSNTANQSVSVIISGSTYPACASQSLKLTGPAPSTTQRGSTTVCSATRTYTLGAVGTYTLTVTPSGFDTGSVTLRVQ